MSNYLPSQSAAITASQKLHTSPPITANIKYIYCLALLLFEAIMQLKRLHFKQWVFSFKHIALYLPHAVKPLSPPW